MNKRVSLECLHEFYMHAGVGEIVMWHGKGNFKTRTNPITSINIKTGF